MIPRPANIRKGRWLGLLGLLGILIFSATLPMTRFTVNKPAASQNSGHLCCNGTPRGAAEAVIATVSVGQRLPVSNISRKTV